MARLPHRRFIGVFTIMFFLQTLFLDAPLVVAGQVDIVDAGSAMAPAAVRAGDPITVASQEPPLVPAEPAELVEQRTVDSRTFQNPDGSFTTEYHTAPIHFADDKGKLQPIEAVAVASDVAGVAYTNKAGPVRVEFGESSSRGDPLRITSAEYSLTYRPLGLPTLPGSAVAADRAPAPPMGARCGTPAYIRTSIFDTRC